MVAVAAAGNTATAAQILAAAQAQKGSPVGAAVAQSFKSVTGGLQPQFSPAASAAENKPASVVLPLAASAAMTVKDTTSGASVSVTLAGAQTSTAQTVGGYVIYPGALAGGAAVLHRALPAGSEDFVYFSTRPATAEVDYTITLGQGVAGLRLIESDLELVDASGTPRLRVAPPYVVGADGARVDGTLAVAGCTVDADPSAPWGRAVTPPGASHCTIQVTWPDDTLPYPAILDPRWTTTGSLVTARWGHTSTLLSTGKVLIVAGTTNGDTALRSAELFDPTSGTWAATASMPSGQQRWRHGAVQLKTGSNSHTSGRVLIAGGFDGSFTISRCELYQPSAGTWSAATSLDRFRQAFTTTLLSDGKVLITGGADDTGVLATAEVFDPSLETTGGWAPSDDLPGGPTINHQAALLTTSNSTLSNKVVIFGGNNGTTTVPYVYLYDEPTDSFTTLTSLPSPREGHTMTVLPNGNILATGGLNGTTTLNTTIMFNPSSGSGSWSSAGTMTTARQAHSATLLSASIVSNGTVLVAGGNNGSGTLSSAELWDGNTTWTATTALPYSVQGQAASALGNGSVLISGGTSGTTTLGSSAVYDGSFGLNCTSNSQCVSGFCVSGVCCDTACTGTCGACNLPGHVGTCSPVATGTICRASVGTCDVAETCSGTSTTCPSDSLVAAGTLCRGSAGGCDVVENCTGSSGVCPTDAFQASGTVCRAAADVCDVAETCSGTSAACPTDAFAPSTTVCRPSAGQCDVAENCTGSVAACPPDGSVADGTTCNDGNACTQTDTCQSGACTGSNPVTCTAQDQCHGAGTCDTSTGACSNPALADGTTCNDGNACTQTDTCQSGACTGSNPVTCTAQDQCHGAGTCDTSTGACSNPALADGTTCNDGNACTQTDTCQSGACTGSNPVTCTAQDQCHGAGTCNSSTGTCSNPALANGTACNDGNACTQTDTCQSGTCTGSNSVTCAAQDQCHGAGTCDPGTGTCSNPVLANGTACNDGNSCTTGDACQSGTCVSGANSCPTLAVTQTFVGYQTFPDLQANLTTATTSAVPGDPVAFDFYVTNIDSFMRASANMSVTNESAQQFVWSTYQVTMSYLSVATQQWVPIAGTSFAADGTQNDVPPLLHLNFANLVGQTIAAGDTADYDSTENVTLPADLINTLGDPAQVTSVRVEIHIDTGTEPGVTTDRDITDSFRNGDTTAKSITGHVLYDWPFVRTVVPLTTSDIAPAQTVDLTGSAPAAMPVPPQPNESATDYASRLVNVNYTPVQIDFGFVGNGVVVFPMKAPAVTAQKSGPAQGNAGLTLPYSVALHNIGPLAASSIRVTDSVNGQDVGAQVTSPTSLDAGATGTATMNAASPIDTTPGSYTDQALVTWQDGNGNTYGPAPASFATSLQAGHPEGYLTLASTGGGSVQIVGQPLTLTATAQDGLGRPVSGVTVHFTITGVNGQTRDVVTGADGTAVLTYNGPNLGQDIASVTGMINGPTLQAGTNPYTWASSVGTPCTGRGTPLDVVMVVDGSPSMFNDNTVLAAQAAADAFIGDLDASRDQIGAVVFNFEPDLAVQLTSDTAAAQTGLNTALQQFTDACSGFCPPDSSDFAGGLQAAFQELTGPRHRSGAIPLLMFISDGGNTGPDPIPLMNQIKAAGIRVISVGMSEHVNIPLMQQIASSKNDYFYAPTAGELGWALQNVEGDVCRTIPPLVSAGGDQGAYEVRLPATLTLQGEVHGAGPQGNFDVTSTWTQLSGPAPVSFLDPTSPTTSVLFTEPGTYVLQIETTDGSLTTASTTTVVVDPDPSIVGANLAIALASPGPLTTGGADTATATLTDGNGVPIRNFIVQFTVGGPNATTATVDTNSAGVATFSYVGQKAGTDVLKATALGSTFALDSSSVSLQWVDPIGSGPLLTQGWIGSPANQSTVMGEVSVTLASTVNLASGTLTYWPSANPSDTHVLTNTAPGNAGAVLATFDSTTLKNGAYVLDLNGTDDHGNTQDNRVLVTVAGDYKPGRVVVETTDFKLPVVGVPITIGRRYDSLDRNKVGDFGNGWSLAIGHPDLQVDQADNVTITMLNGRRVTFFFELVPPAAGSVVLGFLGLPKYVPEPGAFGTLTSDGCSILAFDPGNPTPTCFGAIDTGDLTYAPTTYTYTDPSGIKYVMGADGTLKSITDRSANTLTFAANGIVSSTAGLTVQFTRDGQGRITQVTTPPYANANGFIVTQSYSYTYDDSGNLATFVAPDRDNGPVTEQYQYNTDHLLTKTTDFNGNPARTSTYDTDGRLLTDTDALGNVTSYAYDLPNHKTTTTYPDTGVVTDTFDDRGLLLSHKDQLNRLTTHVYDANRNEISRTNALNETTTYTYDANGNQTSSTNALGEATTTAYNAFSEPISTTNPIGNTTTIAYDENGSPTSIADSTGVLATFTSSERGLPLSVTDAAGNSVYMGYDGAGNLTARTDRLGRATTTQYDALGHLQATFDGRGGRTYNVYSSFGEITAVQNPVGLTRNYHRDNNGNIDVELGDDSRKQFAYVFDALNHVTKKTHVGDGTFVSYTRDFRGNVLTETDEAGHTTSYTYDLAGQLTKTTYADSTFSSQTFDDLGRLSSKTDERSNTTTYGYQAGCGCSERLTTVTDPLNRTTTTTYDGMGRRLSVTDPANHTTSYVYDLRGHQIETDYPDGTSTHDTYDALGRRVTSTDQTGATTTYGYDAEGQLTSVTDPLNHVTQYAYDASGNLTSVTDANTHTTTYAYDAKNRKITRTLPLGMSETFTYNGDDDVGTHTDFRGKTTTFAYDRQDYLASKVPDPSLGEPTVSYVVNPNGTRGSMSDASGTTTYTYDARNRLLTKATPEGTLTYTYDASGNVASIDTSNANGTSVSYAWDAANQLATITDNRLSGMTTAAYTATGRPSSLVQPNGVGVTYSYDSLDRVLSMAWRKGTAPALASWSYSYSPRGQRLSSTDLTSREAAYGYDTASRLTSETITGDPSGNGALTYALDPTGNRLSRSSTLAALGAQSFSYDANDEIATDSYDLNGNTIGSGGHTYGYDFENRLVSKDGAVTIVYDGDGNRVTTTANGVTTRYLADDLNPTGYLQVMDEVSAGAVQVRYTYGNMLVSQTRSASTAPATSFYGYDAHGNIGFLTDGSGTVTDSYTYDAWGNLLGRTGSTLNTRLYVGEELDPDLGLVNLRAREYRADTGRFLTVDPATGDRRKPTTLHRYLYAGADPVIRRDPVGTTEGLEEVASFAEGLAEVADIGLGFNVPGLILHYDPIDHYLEQVAKLGDGQLKEFFEGLKVGGAVGTGLTVSCQIALSTLGDEIPSYLTAIGCGSE